MYVKKWFCFLFIFTLSSLAHGQDRGGWVSSGGELFRFAKNPWFVRNTKDVKYCVRVDEASVSASITDIRRLIREGVAYWKKEFGQSPLVLAPQFGTTEIATQNFVEQSACGDDTDLRFIFGYGLLASEEIQFLKDPQKYIGVTVRTDYDRVHLRGKGFIFISSDQGDHSYHNSGFLIEKGWKHLKLLKYAILHELGHVFGLPHKGDGLMSEVFLDQLLHKRFSRTFLNSPLDSFLGMQSEFETCSMQGEFDPSFFNVDAETACLKLVAQNISQKEWKVFAKQTKTSPPVEIGKLKLKGSVQRFLASRPSLIIQLPKEQKVFSLQERLSSFMMGPLFIDQGGEGFYQRVGSRKPYPVHIEMKKEAFTIVGQVSKKMRSVLVYSPPTLLGNLIGVRPGTEVEKKK